MQFSIPLVQLNKPLQQVIAISPSNTPNDDIVSNILMYVKDNNLILRASDYSIECSCVLPIADVVSEGSIAVNASKLYGSCKNLDPNAVVSFIYDEDEELLSIQSENCKFQIRTRNASEFPTFDFDDVEQKIVIKQSLLKTIFDSTIFCVSSEDFREYLRGVRFECNGDDLSVFTSDAHRMAVAEAHLSAPVENNFGVTLTKKFALELSKILKATDEDVELQFTKGAVSVTCNNYKLTSNLIVCGYPNVRAVIPKSIETEIILPRAQLRSVISRVALLSSKRVNGVSFTFKDNDIHLQSENSEHEIATDSFAIEYSGKTIELALNASYINEILNVINTEKVVFCFTKEVVSAVIKPVETEESPNLKLQYIVSKVVV